ncbi:MAG: ABC transporter substrate-binding protein, partial [Gemmataceae bacterium]|nr:ABC transporter substrate-binding protein [Gemmataceae bacterium]
GTLGTPSNSAIHKYVNAKGVPHIFVNTGATKWGDPKNFPWTMGFNLNYQAEGHIYAKYILETKPDAKIAILFQNDDYGKDYVKGLKDGLGDKAAKMIVAEASYEVTDPTVDSQIVTLKSSGADTFYNVTTPKFAAQAIRKVADLGWKPLHILNQVSASVGSVLTPAGLDKSVGLISAAYFKDPTDPQWANDPDMKAYTAWFKKYYPDGNLSDGFNVAEGLRRRPLPREHHEADGEHPRPAGADDAAGRKVEYEPDRLLPDRIGAAREVRRQGVGTVREGDRALRRIACPHPDPPPAKLGEGTYTPSPTFDGARSASDLQGGRACTPSPGASRGKVGMGATTLIPAPPTSIVRIIPKFLEPAPCPPTPSKRTSPPFRAKSWRPRATSPSWWTSGPHGAARAARSAPSSNDWPRSTKAASAS